jgi:hypothetical protein
VHHNLVTFEEFDNCMKPLLLATLLWARALSVDDAEIVIDVGVDGASRPLVVSADDEPQWAASRFCAEHHLSDSTEGFPCASMLAEEIITQGGRYDVRSSAADATAAALGWEPRGDGGYFYFLRLFIFLLRSVSKRHAL